MRQDWADGPRLKPGEASAALLITPDGRYLLQHRDDLPGIFFPDHWGLFGGGIDPGETPEQALIRELSEELAFTPVRATLFASVGLDFSFAGYGVLPRHVFEVPVTEHDIAGMRQAEGQAMALMTGQEIMATANVVPYDSTVVWQHMARARF